ncbi:MAG: hypothetical protein MUC97_04685 [Bernardetiaceae bacterium]|nr:hypothetical protein [Bernardetiaceae bacterium]
MPWLSTKTEFTAALAVDKDRVHRVAAQREGIVHLVAVHLAGEAVEAVQAVQRRDPDKALLVLGQVGYGVLRQALVDGEAFKTVAGVLAKRLEVKKQKPEGH